MRSGSRTASGFSQRTFERLESRCLLAATTYGNSGQPWNVPLDGVARIEGENYNQGGEGVGYHDTTSANLGGAYRTGERVDVESTAAASNGYNVGWIEPAEWLEYTLNVPQAGAYQINLRTARATAGNTSLVVSSNGVSAPTVIVPSTGDWFAFTTLSTTLTLSAGTQVVRVQSVGGGYNFDYLEVGNPTIMPTGWSDSDIGAPGIAGSAGFTVSNGTWTVSGSGADIWGAADQFNFAHTSLTGDGAGIARVASLSNTDPWAKAGVMFRTDATAGSPMVALLVSPTNGATFEWRSAANGSASQQIASGVTAPVALKLVRAGDTFTAFYSFDGTIWTQVGSSQTIGIGSTALVGLVVTAHNTAALNTASFTGVAIGASAAPGAGVLTSQDELLLGDLQRRSFQFFWNEVNPSTGLVPDRASADGGGAGVASIAATGFGLTALTIADARGWVSHTDAYQRALTTLQFLYSNVPNVHGFYYHFLDANTGQRAWMSEVSSIDTALLLAGVLTAREYWAGTQIETMAMQIYDRVEWPWMQNGAGQIYLKWTPEEGFASYAWGDFSEGYLTYLLAMGSSTHPVAPSAWTSWSRSPVVNYAGLTFLNSYGGALFTQQYPQAWFDLRGLEDNTGLNVFENSLSATLAQRQMCIDLAAQFPASYSQNLWGITASDGPNGYMVWGGPPATANIDGTVVPCAAGGSLAFEPRECLNTIQYMRDHFGGTIYRKYGFVDAFNPTTGWTDGSVLGIDLGVTIVMAENCRTGLPWNTFMQNPEAQLALARGGFRTAEPLPSGWSDSDIGAPPLLGSANFDGSTWTVAGSGSDIWDKVDHFHFASHSFSGDGSVIARVGSLTNTNVWAKAGVMLRNDAGSGSIMAAVLVSPVNGLTFEWRSAEGGTTAQQINSGVAAPTWVKLSRTGNSFSGSYSADGINWTQVGPSQTVPIGSTALAGLAVTSHNDAAVNTATFTNVSLLPVGWSDVDIGSPPLAGAAQFDPASGQWNITGNGLDIWGAVDHFNFANRTFAGDGSLIARIDSQSNTDPWAKTGVMFRQDSAVGAMNAGVFLTPGNGVTFQWRSVANGQTSSTTVAGIGAPAWVKLTRSGSSFSGFYSSAGNNWTQIGMAQTVPISTTALVGLGVSSHSDTLLSTVSASFFMDPTLVTNTNDSGAGSLRQAMLTANTYPVVPHTISFAIAGGGQYSIPLNSNLPSIGDPLTLIVPTGVSVQIGSATNTFGDFSTLTKSGAGLLTINGSPSHATAATLNVNQGTLALGGDGGANLTVNANANTNFAATQHLAALNIGAGATVMLTAGGGKVLVTGGLALAGATDAWTGRLNLNDNDLVLHSTAASKVADTARLTNLLKSGFAAGAWTGTGISSTIATANKTTAIGIRLNDNGTGQAVYTTFSGQFAGANDVLAKFTYYGDANLSGIVDGTDYALVDNGFNFGLTGWVNGDANYSGAMDGTDYAFIDNAFNFQSGTLSAGAPLAIAFAAPAIADPQPSPSLSESLPCADEPAANDRHTAALASLEEATALIPHIRLAETARSETVLPALDPQLIDAALAEILSQIL